MALLKNSLLAGSRSIRPMVFRARSIISGGVPYSVLPESWFISVALSILRIFQSIIFFHELPNINHSEIAIRAMVNLNILDCNSLKLQLFQFLGNHGPAVIWTDAGKSLAKVDDWFSHSFCLIVCLKNRARAGI